MTFRFAADSNENPMTLENNLPVLVFKGVRFAYPGKRTPILDGVDLAIFRGDRVGVIGGNGCGKSTISKLILGILSPQKGSIRLLGKPVSWHLHFPDLGYIGDPGHNAEELGLPTNQKVGSVIATIQKMEGHERMSDIALKELIQALGLQELQHRPIENLSTGERKRLMVCLTFMRKPKFIIMDEPLDGLDESVCRYIKGMITALTGRSEVTLFYIAHDRVEIDSFTDRVYRLLDGKLIPENQNWFEGRLEQKEGTIEFREKTGQVIGRLNEVMVSSDLDNGFNLSIKPADL